MVNWLRHQTSKPEIAGSSPSLTTKLVLFVGRPWFNSLAMLVNSQLPPANWIFDHVMFIAFFSGPMKPNYETNFVPSFGVIGPEKPHRESGQSTLSKEDE